MKLKTVPLLRLCLMSLIPLLALALAGCATTDTTGGAMLPPAPDTTNTTNVDRLQIGDTVTVVFSGLPDDLPKHEEAIKEDGTITLPDIGHVAAAGKTTGELQDAIHNLYVPGLYRHLNVTVTASGDRVYYVQGEVKQPGVHLYVGQTTVTKAITSVGDFTDFANRKNVRLTRANGQHFTINCVDILDGKAPDPFVYPGDKIEVRRKIF